MAGHHAKETTEPNSKEHKPELVDDARFHDKDKKDTETYIDRDGNEVELPPRAVE